MTSVEIIPGKIVEKADTGTEPKPIPSSLLLVLRNFPKTATDEQKLKMLIFLTRLIDEKTVKYYFNHEQASEIAKRFEIRGNRIAKFWFTSIYPICTFNLDGMDGCYTTYIFESMEKLIKLVKTPEQWQKLMSLSICQIGNTNHESRCDFSKALKAEIIKIAELIKMPVQIPDKETKTCVICLEHPKEYSCIPCGHKCLCKTCQEKVLGSSTDNKKCPICRVEIIMICQIYE